MSNWRENLRPLPARGFIGIAFRVRGDRYEYIYLRPTNGRADDQVRRNHSTQYSAHPSFSFAVSPVSRSRPRSNYPAPATTWQVGGRSAVGTQFATTLHMTHRLLEVAIYAR